MVLLGLPIWGHGSREIANWHVSDFVQEAPSEFTIYSVHPIKTGNTLDDLWACGLEKGKSAIYHYHDGQWEKSDPVPHIGDLEDIVMVSPDKGWCLGTNGILEYDGIFWNKVVSGSWPMINKPSISVVSENDVWFGVGYKYENGEYSQFLELSYAHKIFMRDNNRGVIPDAGGFYSLSDSGWVWTPEPKIGVYSNMGIDGEDRIWFTGPRSGGSNQNLNISMTDSLYVIDKNGSKKGVMEGRGLSLLEVDALGDVWLYNLGGTIPPFTFLLSPFIARYTPKSQQIEYYSGPTSVSYDGGNLNLVHVGLVGGAGNWQGIRTYRNRIGPQNFKIYNDYVIATYGTIAPKLYSSNQIANNSIAFFLGELVHPKISAPTSLRFDELPFSELPEVGDVAFRHVMVENLGGGYLDIENISIEGEYFSSRVASFTEIDSILYDPTEDKRYIPTGDSIRVVVAYRPDSVGVHEGKLSIETNDPQNPLWEVTLRGATLGSMGPLFAASDSLLFGNVNIFNSRSRNLVISNEGSASLKIDSLKINGDRFVVDESFPEVIHAGGALSIEVVFSPDALGVVEAQLTVHSDDIEHSVWAVSLTGEGTPLSEPKPTPGTGAISLLPSAPTTADSISVFIQGQFPVTNARIHLDEVRVGVGVVLVDLITEREGQRDEEGTASWQVDVNLPLLENNEYELIVSVNNRPYHTYGFVVTQGALPEGPVSIDFDSRTGNQRFSSVGSAMPGNTISLELHINGAPRISGWNAVIEYDASKLAYVNSSFVPSNFIDGLINLEDDKGGLVNVGGTVLASGVVGSGNGLLGVLQFEVLDGFAGETDLIITEVGYRNEDSTLNELVVRFIATITDEDIGSRLLGDFDFNGRVEFADFFLFAENFGSQDELFDLDGSGAVDFTDFFLFAENFGQEGRAKLIALASKHLGLTLPSMITRIAPNPFNASTNIDLVVAQNGPVSLQIFNLSGQVIRVLTEQFHIAGRYEYLWDGRNDRGQPVSSGLYLVRIQTVDAHAIRKMTLLK